MVLLTGTIGCKYKRVGIEALSKMGRFMSEQVEMLVSQVRRDAGDVRDENNGTDGQHTSCGA